METKDTCILMLMGMLNEITRAILANIKKMLTLDQARF